MPAQSGFDPQPTTLEGKTVRLEPLTLEHGAAMLAIGAEESIWHFLTVPPPSNLEQAEQWIKGRLADQAAGLRLPFAVICLADGKFAGSTGYASINRQHCTLDIASWYGLDYQRTGVNTECKYLLLKHAFEALSARRVGLTVDVKNLKSRQAVERIGAIQEGLLRNHRIRRDGTQRDTVVYGFNSQNWPRSKANLEGLMNRYGSAA